MKGDPLWLPFGEERDAVVDELIDLQKTRAIETTSQILRTN